MKNSETILTRPAGWLGRSQLLTTIMRSVKDVVWSKEKLRWWLKIHCKIFSRCVFPTVVGTFVGTIAFPTVVGTFATVAGDIRGRFVTEMSFDPRQRQLRWSPGIYCEGSRGIVPASTGIPQLQIQ